MCGFCDFRTTQPTAKNQTPLHRPRLSSHESTKRSFSAIVRV